MEWMRELRPDLNFPVFGDSGIDVDISFAHCPERVLPGQVLRELVENGKEFELKYIIAKKEKNFYPFLSDLYSNEANYPYMVKIFDSNELGYKKLKVKVFEIDYEKFNNNNE